MLCIGILAVDWHKKTSRTISRVLSRIIIYLDLMLPQGSSNLPEARRAASTLLLGLASDGVYNALSVTSQAVSSYLAISPLPYPEGCGGILSVALSFESPQLDVIQHPAL